MIPEDRCGSQKSKRCTKGLNSTVLDVDNLPRKELNLVTDNPRKFGRAVVTPHTYHSKKVGRNKAAVEANKQQVHISLTTVGCVKTACLLSLFLMAVVLVKSRLA